MAVPVFSQSAGMGSSPIWQFASQGLGAAGSAVGAYGQQGQFGSPQMNAPPLAAGNGGTTTSDIIRLLSQQGAIQGQGAVAQGQAAAQQAQDTANKWKTVLSIAAMAAAFI